MKVQEDGKGYFHQEFTDKVNNLKSSRKPDHSEQIRNQPEEEQAPLQIHQSVNIQILSDDEKFSSVRKIELRNDLSQDGMANLSDQGDAIEENKRELERRSSIPKSYLKNTVKFDQADNKNSAGRVFETKNSNVTVEDSRNSSIFITN